VTLAEALELAALSLPDVERRDEAGGREWLVGDRPFAAVAGPVAEFRLQPLVAKAALGTSDTSPSRRGPDWIAFAPAELDRFALDRATAWLASAHRHAGVRRN
jgi:hypothetical protein